MHERGAKRLGIEELLNGSSAVQNITKSVRLTILVVTSLTFPHLFDKRAVPLARLTAKDAPQLYFFASNTTEAKMAAVERGCVPQSPTFADDNWTILCPELSGRTLTWLDCYENIWGAGGPCCKVDRAFFWYRKHPWLRNRTDYLIFSDDDFILFPPSFEVLLGMADPSAPWVATVFATRIDYGSDLFNQKNKNFFFDPTKATGQMDIQQFTKASASRARHFVFAFPPNDIFIAECKRKFKNHNASKWCSLCAEPRESEKPKLKYSLRPYYGFANPLLASRAAIDIMSKSLANDGLHSVCWHTGFTHDRALAFYSLLHEIPNWSILQQCSMINHDPEFRKLNVTQKSNWPAQTVPTFPFFPTKNPDAMEEYYSAYEQSWQNMTVRQEFMRSQVKCLRESHIVGLDTRFLHSSAWYKRTGGLRRARKEHKPVPPYTLNDCAVQEATHSIPRAQSKNKEKKRAA